MTCRRGKGRRAVAWGAAFSGRYIAPAGSLMASNLASPYTSPAGLLPCPPSPILPAAVREADLLPSVALLFRWTGQSAAEMAHMPALRQELLRAARPATAAY